MRNNIYELYPQYDSRHSFYHKALVVIYKDYKSLLSYETEVCRVYKNESIWLNPNLEDSTIFSMTTLRHIKEFIRQELSICITLKELRKLR